MRGAGYVMSGRANRMCVELPAGFGYAPRIAHKGSRQFWHI